MRSDKEINPSSCLLHNKKSLFKTNMASDVADGDQDTTRHDVSRGGIHRVGVSVGYSHGHGWLLMMMMVWWKWLK
jgi:hypothetical protein